MRRVASAITDDQPPLCAADSAPQVETLFARDFSPRAPFEIGYRWIDVDYQDDNNDFIFDVMTQGPQAGVSFRF